MFIKILLLILLNIPFSLISLEVQIPNLFQIFYTFQKCDMKKF